MKIFLSIISLFSISYLQAQDVNFEQTVNFIQNKVYCCSVPFSKSTQRKVDSIDIGKNGNITLSYSDKKVKHTFNLFELHKETEKATGIDTIIGGKFIQFYVNEKRIRMIRFATAADAKEIYAALLRLFILCRRETKMFSRLNFEQTLDVINAKLVKWSERGNVVTISALENGNIKIKNKWNQLLQFNFFDLPDTDDNEYSRNGIEIIPCDTKAHAQLAWINFNTTNGSGSFIRFDCKTPLAELEIIRGAFLHLRSLCVEAGSQHHRINLFRLLE